MQREKNCKRETEVFVAKMTCNIFNLLTPNRAFLPSLISVTCSGKFPPYTSQLPP
uniref:Uncharacterized protein n=1 Tax=Anguilla anguilla TaxID=7936 RepID=A0A0E9SIW3_ANGAN